ncbi:prolipoprotein diacylglyceryl transferase [Actinomadura welshii]|uniref:Phosphatidylglycerol--prolipoprotein diacylglyceryl transferase n=1 Tax=Actinomadura livida TaxID=79909 RepID=A0A7W7IFZ6_9ACTN|nr:prolipoprotein diacylglyceryl transferase [Actinomadura catellatispora]MBB4776295.1 prolipoprotein diacylglyceryl transferase [Actinomadura catellatispora]
MQPLAYIPSPSQGIWHIGPVPIRAYAIMIILGIVAAVWLGERRWAAKGGTPGVIIDVAVWAVPFGLVGGRIYHVLTDYQLYFGEDGDPARALEIWQGGLGIWGAVAFGAVGALIGCRRRGISIYPLADAVAPGIALAQAIGRWGNYWNQELYGRPLDTFWALKIDEDHRPMLEGGPGLDPRYADIATYHPTFLYESLWCIGVAVLVIWADRRFKLTHGRAFALYVAAYTLGRAWIETLRIDEAHHILGLRLNTWTSVILFLAAVAYLYQARNRTGPENVGGPADGPSDPAGPAGEEKDAPKDGPKDAPVTGKEPESAAGGAESGAKDDPEPGSGDEPESPGPEKPEGGKAADDVESAASGDDEAEEPKDGAGKDGAGKDGAGKDGAGKDGAGKDGAGKDGAGKDGAGDAGRVEDEEPVKDGK